MKKKMLALMLSSAMVLSLIGCGQASQQVETPATEESTEETVEETAAETETTEAAEAAVSYTHLTLPTKA